ncbi:serine hydrolase [Cereibacter sp. SYSU M97828]|nr:serine hydrolase [Cereibacter flavus]
MNLIRIALVALLPLPALAETLDGDLLAARMGAFMESEIEAGRIAGAVALAAQDGDVVLLRAYGTSDAGGTRQMQPDDLFRIASMTKSVVTLAAMMLVEEGRLALDAPIADHLPELAGLKMADGTDPARQPTVQDLMRHSGGFTYSAFGAADPALRKRYAEADLEQVRSDMTAEEMLTRLAGLPLAFEPGTRFEYSLGVDLLGFIVERIEGERLDAVLERRIFAPLGMDDTGFAVAAADVPRLAEVPQGDPMKPFTEGWMRVEKPRGEGYLSGGGGLVSTAADYLRFARMVMDGGELDGVRILSPASLRLMMSNHIAGMDGGPDGFTGPGYGFGLGFAVRLGDGGAIVPGSPGDANWSGLNGTTFTVDPEQEIVAILMAAAPTARNHLRFGFRNIVYGALHD